MAVRIYKEENGTWEPTAYSIGMMYKDAIKIEMENHTMDLEVAMAMYDSSIGKSDDSMMPTNTYQGKEYDGCGCPTCKELNVNCDNCPVCQAEGMKTDCCPDLSKQAPCWDGYVQRGMKPGDNGKPVPNCVPAAKADDLFEDDDTVEYDTYLVVVLFFHNVFHKFFGLEKLKSNSHYFLKLL
jgi:hypothetical protein